MTLPSATPPAGSGKRTFPKRVGADQFTASVETDKTRRAYTDAFRGKLPVGQ